MPVLHRPPVRFIRFAAFALAAAFAYACKTDSATSPATTTATTTTPVLTSVKLLFAPTVIVPGQTGLIVASGIDQDNLAFPIGAVTWTSSVATVATVSSTGIVTAVAPGTTVISAATGGKTGTMSVTVAVGPGAVINEVESNGGTPGDWVELYNPTNAAIDISGWGFRDNDATHTIYKIPAGTSIAAKGYYLIEEADFGFGLGAADEARLFNQFGATHEVYAWTAHATTTYGRCANGTGDMTTTGTSTKGAANDCSAAGGGGTPTAPLGAIWPGSDDVTTVDGTAVFGGNLSGLMYEAAVGTSPAVLWGARNGPGSIFRLIFSGGIWTPDPANGWGAGKLLKYPNGTGEPDTEDITFAAGGSAAGLYTIAERDNSNNGVSRNSILRWDPSGTTTSLTATNEWNLTADLPVTGANLGIEGVTWVPDAFLTSKNFFDEAANKVYNPADYANHGTGLFFMGVEATGNIYVYALNHNTNTFTRVATIITGYTAGIMAVNFDRELNYLWGVCDNGCGGTLGIWELNATGRFARTQLFQRPSTMPNINNEGFAMATQSTCVAGLKQAFWADDSETGGHSIRTARVPCVPFTVALVQVRP